MHACFLFSYLVLFLILILGLIFNGLSSIKNKSFTKKGEIVLKRKRSLESEILFSTYPSTNNVTMDIVIINFKNNIFQLLPFFGNEHHYWIHKQLLYLH